MKHVSRLSDFYCNFFGSNDFKTPDYYFQTHFDGLRYVFEEDELFTDAIKKHVASKSKDLYDYHQYVLRKYDSIPLDKKLKYFEIYFIRDGGIVDKNKSGNNHWFTDATVTFFL